MECVKLFASESLPDFNFEQVALYTIFIQTKQIVFLEVHYLVLRNLSYGEFVFSCL
jgi:hypothetical protein